MEKLYRNLVYHFYLTPDFEENYINKVHFYFLEKYCDRFDESLFCAYIDNYDEGIVSRFEKKIISLGYKNVSFKIHENNPFKDGKTFYDEVASKLDTFKGIVFYAHNKGYTNVPYFPKDSIANWVGLLYYLSLEHINEVDAQLSHLIYWQEKIFYGPIKITREDFPNKNKVFYSGCFFWTNPRKIYKMDIGKITDRGYAELFPGEHFGIDKLGSHALMSLNLNNGSLDMYYESLRANDYLFVDDDKERYEVYWNDIQNL